MPVPYQRNAQYAQNTNEGFHKHQLCQKFAKNSASLQIYTPVYNCSPANDERLAVKLDRELSSSFAPFAEKSRFSESAQDFSRGLRESRQRLLHSAHDEEWVAFKKIDSELS